METKCYRTFWIVRHSDDSTHLASACFATFLETAWGYQCHVCGSKEKLWEKNEAGLTMLVLDWRVPSENIFNYCLQEVREFIPFEKIIPISEDLLYPPEEMANSYILMRNSHFLHWINQIADENKQLMRVDK